MTDSPFNSDSLVGEQSSDANPLSRFHADYPGAIRSIVIGTGVGMVLGVTIGLLLPGWGAWYRVGVALCMALGFGIVGGLYAGARATRSRFGDD